MCLNCCWKTLIYIATYEDFRESILSFISCFQPRRNPTSGVEREFRKSLPQIFLSDSTTMKQKELETSQRKRLVSVSFPVTIAPVHNEAEKIRRMSLNVPNMLSSYEIQRPQIHILHEMKSKQQINRHASMRSPTTTRPSPSKSNLTRSRSMTIQTKHFKHSPNCKLRKKFEI